MALRIALIVSVIAIIMGPGQSAHAKADVTVPSIAIKASADRRWTVTYVLKVPIRVLMFDRSPDDSRSKSWTVPTAFELVATDQGEIVRRRDRHPFTNVTATVPAAYQDLPKDYAPFSPFGDGGMLFHSGRFFACGGACPDAVNWRFLLNVPALRHILVNGRRYVGSASWRDHGQGRNVYVGKADAIETPDALAIIDASLPQKIRERLNADLPKFMRFFAARLGALASRPMLFASYDANHRPGWGRQGGTFPGEVFTHFYGSGWQIEMAKSGFDFDLAWHFAHEAAHLYQRQITTSEPGGAWVHEGAAEAFAAIALRQLDPSSHSRVDLQIAAASAACAKATATQPLSAVIAKGNFDAAYSCGLVINLAIHDASLAADPTSNGLFGVWRDFMRTAGRDQPLAISDYNRAVARGAGACVKTKVEAAISITPLSNFADAVRICGKRHSE